MTTKFHIILVIHFYLAFLLMPCTSTYTCIFRVNEEMEIFENHSVKLSIFKELCTCGLEMGKECKIANCKAVR